MTESWESRVETRDRAAEILVIDSEGQQLHIEISSVHVNGQEIKPMIWLERIGPDSHKPMLITPATWRELVTEVEHRLVRPSSYS